MNKSVKELTARGTSGANAVTHSHSPCRGVGQPIDRQLAVSFNMGFHLQTTQAMCQREALQIREFFGRAVGLWGQLFPMTKRPVAFSRISSLMISDRSAKRSADVGRPGTRPTLGVSPPAQRCWRSSGSWVSRRSLGSQICTRGRKTLLRSPPDRLPLRGGAPGRARGRRRGP